MTVRFDHAAADEAVRQLTLTAESLGSMAALLAHDAPIVAEEWRGRFRTTFDAESARHAVVLATMADGMVATAARIRAEQWQAQVDAIQEERAEEPGG